MDVIDKLLSRLDQAEDRINSKKTLKNDSTIEESGSFSEMDSLNSEITKLIQENHAIRKELWTAKEETEELKMKLMEKLRLRTR